MLHILWMILKFILIVLGILLGLLLLAAALLLFCPVCYRAQASGSLEEWKKAQGTVSISWLFRGIVLTLRLEDGKTAHNIRILGIPVDKLKRRRKPSGSAGKASSKRKRSSPEKKKIQSEELSGQPKKVQPVKSSDSQKEVQNREKTQPDSSEIKKVDAPDRLDTAVRQKNRFFQKIRNNISGMKDKLKKISAVIRNFRNGIQNICDKIDYWRQFWDHPMVKEAMSFAWQRVRRLVKHILPVRIEGHVTFGCEDPSVTGTALAILGMTIPFHKNCIDVHPLFEGQNHLEGEVKLRGRVYGIILVITAVQVYFNKNIKYVISRWKHKEESL